MIYLGADHKGYKLKEVIKNYLSGFGYKFEDLGNKIFDKEDDYVDFAEVVAKKVVKNANNRGVLFCGSGTGMMIAANKIAGARAIVGFSEKIVKLSRQHNDSNILSIPSDFLKEKEAVKIIKVWLSEKFSKEKRHIRRIKKIEKIEKQK